MSALINLIGRRFGSLVVKRRQGWDGSKNAVWLCQCDCGNRVPERGTNLTAGLVHSCGCQKGKLISETKKGQARERRNQT